MEWIYFGEGPGPGPRTRESAIPLAATTTMAIPVDHSTVPTGLKVEADARGRLTALAKAPGMTDVGEQLVELHGEQMEYGARGCAPTAARSTLTNARGHVAI